MSNNDHLMPPRRKVTRLAGYDYREPGAYFVTLVTKDRASLFGRITAGRMRLSPAGQAVGAVWEALPTHYEHVELDAFVIMPDHVHAILRLRAAKDSDIQRRHGLPEIMRGFKTFSARRVNERRRTPGVAVWQRNYYEHIIRNEFALERIRSYIADIPRRWSERR